MYLRREGRVSGLARETRWIEARGMVLLEGCDLRGSTAES